MLNKEKIAVSTSANAPKIKSRYRVKIAESLKEIESALRLRFEVFKVELAKNKSVSDSRLLEFDEFDNRCKHLIVIDELTHKTVGTYRLNFLENNDWISDFYSFTEFRIEDLPAEILKNSVEIGRACVAQEYRNSKVLFLLWKGLAQFLKDYDKRYFFGCCSIFTTEFSIGQIVFNQLRNQGFIDEKLLIEPREEKAENSGNNSFVNSNFPLPPLFNMYLKVGAKICSKPIIDEDFGTTDFFVLFDRENMNEKYAEMFFGEN